MKDSENLEFVHGKGKRKTSLQKSIETLNEYQLKLKEYTKKFETSKKFNAQRKAELERILTYGGCVLRMNQRIQAERFRKFQVILNIQMVKF